jgi:protein phosphatase
MKIINHLYKKDIGGREEQQDSVNILQNEKTILMALADGMGGHSGGRKASELFVTTAEEHFKSRRYKEEKEFFNNIISDTVSKIEAYAKEQNQDPHTTATLALIVDNQVHFTNVGDSRVYIFDKDALLIRTRDHSIPEMLLQMGEIEEHEMATHPDQNKLTKSLGSNLEVKATQYSYELKKGSDHAILLCSDGFWEYVKEDEMRYFLFNFELEKALNSMIALAKKRGGERGDNISVAVTTLFYDEESEVLEKTKKIQKTDHTLRKQKWLVPLITSVTIMGILAISLYFIKNTA